MKNQNIKFIKKSAKWYKIGKANYSKTNMQLAVLETNLILNNI